MSKHDYCDAHGCRNSGMPLGGIGAGSLEIRPDGYLYRWSLMNNRPWGSGPATGTMERYGLRFGLSLDWGEGVRCLALGRHHGLDPNEDSWFWFSDPYHLPWVEHTRQIHYEAKIPFAELVYEFDDVPIEIGLRAWSPFIPYQPDDSNTPGAVLTFRIRNPTDRAARVSLMGVLKNAVGYDHPELPSQCRPIEGEPAGLLFARDGLPDDANTRGTMGLFAFCPEAHGVSYAIHVPHGRALWDPLMETGRLENRDYGRQTHKVGEVGAEVEIAGPKGLTRGALCLDFTVAPAGTVACTFLLTWHFPNFWELDHKNAQGRLIGAQYANRFRDAADVAKWLARERGRLEADARRFHEAFYETTLPEWLLRAVAAGWSVLYRSAWWDRAGRFGIWEGLGCCGMQTIDVGHYASLASLQFFPDLEASQNRLSAANREPSGKVPHLMPGNFGCSDWGGGRGRIDLGAQFALAVWRNALWRGQIDLAGELWPAIERNMQLLEEFDTDGDGLPNNQGPDQTYDRFPIHGTSAYVGFLYLAALRAAADMAEWLGKKGLSASYKKKAERAAGELEQQLWNGQYYSLSHNAEEGTNAGCMTDQLNGDWFYRQSSGRGLVEEDRVRRSLAFILKHNRRTAGRKAWLSNCTWPHGTGAKVTLSGSDQVNCPWSGVEYAVAAHLILMGMRDEGRQVAWDVFRRYEEAGMRFNHIECGEFYYRAMSVWAIYQAEFGLAYDGLAECLHMAPPAGDATFLVTVPSGCAQAHWNEAARELKLAALRGHLSLRTVTFRGKDVRVGAVRISAGEQTSFTIR